MDNNINNNIKFYVSLIMKINSDYLLINRLIYKTKNLFGRHRHFQQICFTKKFLQKFLKKLYFQKNQKESVFISNFLKILNDQEMIKNICNFMDLLLVIGRRNEEMMKIKLYLPFSTVIYGIISRIYEVFNYIVKNKEKIIKNI